MVIMAWCHYDEHQVAPLRRSQGGAITVNTKWIHMSDH